MRLFKVIVILMVNTMLLWGCGKEYSYEGGGKLPPIDTINGGNIVKSEWRFTETEFKYAGPVDTAYLTQEGIAAVLTITGKTTDGRQNIYIKLKDITGKIQKGKTYKTTLDQVKFLYRQANETLYSAIPYKGGDVYVTVSDYDSTRIIGTFKGLVKDKNMRSLSVADGYFSSPLKKAPPGQVTGYAMLWATELCNGPIKVKVNNIDGGIEQAVFSAPDCGEAGGATYQLSPGAYNWVAYCGKDSVAGIVTVKANDCAKIQIKFPFKPAPVTYTEKELICKISEVQFSGDLESDSDKSSNHVIAEYKGSNIDIFKYYVVPVPVIFPHIVTYEPNTIVLALGQNWEKRFVTDAKGRIVQYSGPADITIMYPTDRNVKIKYYYDSDGHLIKRELFDARSQALKVQSTYTWKNGNLIRSVENFPLLGHSKETEYEYYDKEVKAMPFIDFNAFELVLFQPLFDIGVSSKNILKRITVYTLGNATSYDYDSYVIDDNGYVLSCRMYFYTGNETNLNFNYKCF
jgi:hypothetical protein